MFLKIEHRIGGQRVGVEKIFEETMAENMT